VVIKKIKEIKEIIKKIKQEKECVQKINYFNIYINIMENSELEKVEEIINENKNLDNNVKSLIHFLKNLLVDNNDISNNILSEINIKLNEQEKEILSKILKYTPEVFDNIEAAMKRIVEDNKIDTKDTSDIIICIQQLYQLIYNFKTYKMDTKKRCDLCASLVKFTIHILLEERIIKVEEDKKNEILKNIDVLVDSAINLIGLSKMIKHTSCVKKLFGKK
jgi:hypothetical protein